MRLHPNAKLTPWARHRLAQRVRKQGWPLARAAREAGVSRPTAYKWLNRFDSEGQVGLQDRSSRPHRIPKRTPLKAIRRMERLRRRRKTAWEIALETGIPASQQHQTAAARICHAAGPGGRSAHLQPSGVSVRRIESEEPSTRRKSGHEPAPFGTTRHYVAQDQPLHVVVGGCALSSEGVCILGFRPDLHRVQGAVATWVKTGERPYIHLDLVRGLCRAA